MQSNQLGNSRNRNVDFRYFIPGTVIDNSCYRETKNRLELLQPPACLPARKIAIRM